MTSVVTALLPRWTKRVSIEEGGRDPLGLSRVSSMITDFLLQGIITQIYRARYYSFYCWAIWHVETEEHPTTYDQFARAFQRRDTMFTLASLEFNRTSSPVGIRVAEPRLLAAKKGGEVPCDFSVLPSNPLGAFGQYYAGSIFELGLASRDEKGICHVSPAGEELARAFQASIKDTPYLRKKLYLDSSVSWSDFAKTFTKFNLDQLADEVIERELLMKLFLSDGPRSDRALMRRSSLALLMSVINAYNTAGASVNYGDVWELLYAPTYYGQLQFIKGRVRGFNVPTNEKSCVEFWQCFCLHQFLTQALENLLAGVLDAISGELAGLTVQEICFRLTSQPFVKALNKIHGSACKRPCDLLRHLGLTSPTPDSSICCRNQLRFDLTHPSSESQILDLEPGSEYERTAVAVSLLATLYAKWGGLTTEAMRYVSINAGAELHFNLVLPYLVDWFDKGVSWADAIRPIVSKLILDQHDRIMYEKGKLDSCWLHRAEGKVHKDQDYSPTYRSPRTDNSVSILTDLGLLKMNSEKQLAVTARGNSLLRRSTP